MKKLHLSLSLSNPGERTHVWFPLPQRDTRMAVRFVGGIPTIIKERTYGNAVAYFFVTNPTCRIDAEFSVSKAGDDRGAQGNPVFLISNRYVNSDDEVITTIARQLTKNVEQDTEKARRCFDWVVAYLSYANPIRGLYSSLQALTDRQVDCGGFSTLLVALLRSIKIPARCVFGWAIRSKFGYHAWVEYFDRQKESWIPADPSVTHLGKRTKLDAGFGFINDERVIFSVGEDVRLPGRDMEWRVPLLQSPVVITLDSQGVLQHVEEHLTWSYR